MLDNGDGRPGKFADQVDGRVNIHQVVVRQFLAVKFMEYAVEVAKETALLVRVFAVTHGHRGKNALFERLYLFNPVEIVEDHGVVMGRDVKGPCCKQPALVQACASLVFNNDLRELPVKFCCGHHHDMGVIFGSRTDQGDPPDVDLFDDLLFADGGGNRFFKWIEVDDDQVDGGNIVLFNIADIGKLVAAPEDAAKYFGMKRFHPPPQDGRVGGDRLDGDGVDAPGPQEVVGSSGRDDPDA